MSTLLDIFSIASIGAGLIFFAAAVAGVLRFPDTLTRLHGLAKADNLGLGLVVLGLLPQAPDLWMAGKMVAVWLLMQIASGAVGQLMASAAAREQGDES